MVQVTATLAAMVVLIAPYEGSQHLFGVTPRLFLGEVLIAPYEGSQPFHVAIWENPARCVLIAPYEGSQQAVAERLLVRVVVLIAPYEGSQPRSGRPERWWTHLRVVIRGIAIDMGAYGRECNPGVAGGGQARWA